MTEGKDILEELRSINSPLADISRAMPYKVPESYFEKLVNETLTTVQKVEEPETKPNWGTNPFSVPAGYFEQLSGNILAAAKTEDISVTTKEMPYRVPVGYFEHLPAQIVKAIKVLNGKKTIPLSGKNMFRRVQWAAAAIFIIFMGIGGYMTFFNNQPYSDKILASIPGNEIHDYLQHTYRLDVDRVIGNSSVSNLQVDNKEIEQYLDENGWDVVE
jgi:hypothetical protein